MRTLSMTAFMCLILFACSKKEPEYTEPATCNIKCQDPQIKLHLHYTADTLKGMTLFQYTDDGTFSDTIQVSNPQTVYVSPGYDYQLYLPVLGKSYLISYINVPQSEKTSFCGDECVNPLSGISVRFNWQTCYFSTALTAKREYTVYL